MHSIVKCVAVISVNVSKLMNCLRAQGSQVPRTDFQPLLCTEIAPDSLKPLAMLCAVNDEIFIVFRILS